MKSILLSVCLFLAFSGNAQIRKLQVESNHSTIGFNISIANFTKVTGKFTDYEILVDWNDEKIVNSKISAVIQAASINTGIPERDTHLQSADFFDVSNFPTITFTSDSIRQRDFSNFEAFGKFTMHGITKDIILPFQIVKMDGNTIGFKCLRTIKRLDYEVGTEFKHTAMPDFLSNEIEVEIYFWTKKKKTKKVKESKE